MLADAGRHQPQTDPEAVSPLTSSYLDDVLLQHYEDVAIYLVHVRTEADILMISAAGCKRSVLQACAVSKLGPISQMHAADKSHGDCVTVPTAHFVL